MRLALLITIVIIASFWGGWAAHGRLASVQIRYAAPARPSQDSGLRPIVRSSEQAKTPAKKTPPATQNTISEFQSAKQDSPAQPIAGNSPGETPLVTTNPDPGEMLTTAYDIRQAIAQLNDLDHPETIDRILMSIALLPDQAQQDDLWSYLGSTMNGLNRNSPQETQPNSAQDKSATATMPEDEHFSYGGILQNIHTLDPEASDRDDRVTQLLISIQQLPDSQQQNELMSDLARQLQP